MKIIQKKLHNGLRILMIPQAEAATATVLVLVGTGSKHETKQQNGVSHFLEHMYFKGAKNYPTAQSIAEAFDTIGAISNAFTSHEYTGYYAKGSPTHVDTFIDILGDIYLHSTFPEHEIEKEKGVVIEEIHMAQDNPQHMVWDTLFQLMYGDQPAGRTIAGPKENVLGFTRKDVIKYQQRQYTAGNTIVVVAGAIDPTVVQKQIRKVFAGINTAIAHRSKKVVDTQKHAQAALYRKDTDQAHIVIGFRSIPIGHPDSTALSLLATLLGSSMSSRLFVKLREEMGAAYYVRAEQDGFVDHGIFTITAGIDKNRFEEIVKAIIAVLKELKTTPVSVQELRKVKEYSLGMMRLGLESSDSIAGFYGVQLLLKGKYQTPEQLTKEHMKVTAADIQRLAKQVFVEHGANLSILGPFQEDAHAADIFQGL